MSYLVLARKYRPKSFSQMVGQEHVVQALTNALASGRLHHAYMFTGTRGVGKTTVSRILAKSLNCTGVDGLGGVTATPCGVCQACTEIDAGRFVDYTELDAASNRGVDEVQSLLEQAVYKPVQGRFKVFMIDEVHMLTNTAFNAMLKTLEEPPEYLKFVLATTDPQKVPVTVLSRCLQFNLRPMAPDTVYQHLQQVLQAESIEAESGALHLLARAARGSMRDALSLTDQAIAFSAGQTGTQGVHTEAVRQMLGNVDSSYVLRLIRALAQHQPADVLEVVQQLQLNGLSAANTLEEMQRVLQRMAIWQMVPNQPVDNDHPEEQEIYALAQELPADETQLLYSLCLHGRQELGLAPDEYSALTMVLLRLMPFRQTAAAAAEKKTLKPEAALVVAVAAPVASEVPAPVAPAAVEPVVEKKAPSEEVALPVVESPPAPEPRPEAPPIAPEVVVPSATLPSVSSAPPAQATDIPPWEDTPQEAPTWAEQPQSYPEPSGHDLSLPVHTQPEVEPPVASTPAQAAVRLVPTELGEQWFAIYQGCLAHPDFGSGLARTLMWQSQLMAQGEGVWEIRVELEALNRDQARQRLEQVLAAQGHPVRLQVQYGRVVDTPCLREGALQAEQMVRAEQAMQTHPYVQNVMRAYDARIVPNSVDLQLPERDASKPHT